MPIPQRFLGDSGVTVSEICLGTMTFGKETSATDAEAIMDAFTADGGNFIDTADVYNSGASESIVGNWLSKQDRSKFIVATKASFFMKVYFGGPSPNAMGLGVAHIKAALAGSLERLQTTYIDLYQIHSWDSRTPCEVWLATMAQLVAQGTVRMVGISNVTGWQLQKIVTTAKALRVPLVSLQSQYSLLCRGPELELLDCCAHEGVSMLCWSPLKGGWLSGKFKRGSQPDESSRVGMVEAGKQTRLQSHPSYSQFSDSEKVWSLLEGMEFAAKEHGSTVPQVAIRWLLQRPAVAAVVIGARTVEHYRDNVAAATAGWVLTDAEMASLGELSQEPLGYPYEMVWRTSARGAERLDGNLFPLP